jgi:hypothetical protein
MLDRAHGWTGRGDAMNKTLLGTGLVAVTCVPILAGATQSSHPANADEVVINIPVSRISQPIVIEPTIIPGDNLIDVSITLPAAEGRSGQVAPECTDIPGTAGLKTCIGTSTNGPIDVAGEVDRGAQPLVKWSKKAQGALGWMVPEGVEFTRAFYDLPSDDRIMRYGRAHLRTYMVDRLLDIMDRKVYGVPLTENERNALAFVEGQYKERDRLVAQAAYDEYQRFELSPCTYRPPRAPAVVKNPETLSKKVVDWCKLPKTQITDLFIFAPPLPTAAQFTAWGAYRNADKLGLTDFADPVVLGHLTEMAIGAATLGGFAIAGLTGGSIFAVVTALEALETFGLMVFPYAVRAASKLGEMALEAGANGLGASVAGAIAAAVIAAAVIVFLVVTAVSIYLLIEHDAVKQTLQDRVDETKNETDPFGLNKLAEDLSGKPLNSELDPNHPPAYRSDASRAMLMSQVARWTTRFQEDLPPGVQPHNVEDPVGLWADNATGPSDFTWMVKVGDGDYVERKVLRVPQRGGTATVRFSRGWMIVDKTPYPSAEAPVDPPPVAALEFGFLDRDETGEPHLVTRDPTAPDKLIDSYTFTGDLKVQRGADIFFVNPQGVAVRAHLKGRRTTYLAGPRPVAVGPLFAGRPVLLRPNPVGTNGASLDETTVQQDYGFDWTVERLDAGTGQWSEIPVPDGYGTSFVPAQPGQYDARVTMTSVEDPSQKKYGSVRFTVTPPPIEAPVLALVDNGFDRLELDLQFLEDVPGDHLTVEVTWPGRLDDGTDTVQTIPLDCIRTGPIECTTPRTGQFDSLVFPVTSSTDLRRPVKLRATSSSGGSFEAEFLLKNGRPTIASPPTDANVGEPGVVLVGDSSTQITLPLDAAAGVQNYVAATLQPSPGGGQDFGLVDPATGNTTGAVLLPGLNQGVAQVFEDPGSGTWYLAVRGTPDTADIGSFEVPLVVAQTNGTRQLFVVVVQIVPSTKDRYRGALQSTVDPSNIAVETPPDLFPVVLGGRVSDPRYTGEMCVSLQHRDFGQPAKVRCRPLSDFVDAGGVAKRFPYAKLFPSGMRSGSYRAEAWLNTPGARVDTGPMGTSFILTKNASYPRPTVALGAVNAIGTPVVGRRLSAVVASVDPPGATLRYQWLRDGRNILNATGKTYLLRRLDRGHGVSVRVVATFPEWTSTTKTSATRLIR